MLNHPSAEVVEQFALGRLEGLGLDEFEEHLLSCEQCQDELAETDEFIAAMKQALDKLQKEKVVGAEPKRSWGVSSWLGWAGKPVWACALAAVTLAVVVWLPQPAADGDGIEVTLRALRGPSTEASVAPAGKPFRLHADTVGLPDSPAYRLEVVSSSGTVVWRGELPQPGGEARAATPLRLAAGQYWVRISDSAGVLLREYALESR
jgi:anti-sigma factor RsiW